MIGAGCTTRFDRGGLRRRAREGAFRGLGHAAAALRLTARRSIRRGRSPAPIGAPPHTRRGRLKEAILYALDESKLRAVIGPSRRIIGIAGAEQEHGGRWRKERFPRRPYMAPALDKIKTRLPANWAGTIR